MGQKSPSPLSSSSLLLVLFFSSTLPFTSAYFADWSSFAERDRQPTCVDIPSNMTLCQNIGEKMFLGSLWADMYVVMADALVPWVIHSAHGNIIL